MAALRPVSIRSHAAMAWRLCRRHWDQHWRGSCEDDDIHALFGRTVHAISSLIPCHLRREKSNFTIKGRRTFLRFVSATPAWKPKDKPGAILRETGTCLRLIDCEEDTPRHVPEALTDGVFAFWDVALEDILGEWDELSDPANLQPSIRPLNRQVAAFIRAHPPHDMDQDRLSKALDVLEAPWPRREEMLLREQFRDRSSSTTARSLRLIEWILATGLERFEPPAPLPAILPSDGAEH
jgi:hypothetical protein